MTSRERLEAALRGEPTDRRPWAPEINAALMDKLLADEPDTVRNGPASVPYAAACRKIGADTLLSVAPVRRRYRTVEVRQEREGEVTWTFYETPRGTLRTCDVRSPDAHTSYQTEHLVKSAADFPAYRSLVEDVEFTLDAEGVQQQIDQLGEDGIVSLDGPATPLLHLIMFDMRLPAVQYELADHEREFVELMDVMHERNKEYYRLAAQAPGRMVRPFEDTSTTLLSPAQYRRFCQPCLADYAALVQSAGKQFVPHLCGLLKGVLPDLAATGLDGIEALTPPPTGDVPYALAREALGPDALLIGGLDATQFARLGPDDTRAMLRAVLREARGDRRFVLGHEEISVRANLDSVMVVREVIAEEDEG
jgi:uroporphyrinogen-III decarboxylase